MKRIFAMPFLAGELPTVGNKNYGKRGIEREINFRKEGFGMLNDEQFDKLKSIEKKDKDCYRKMDVIKR